MITKGTKLRCIDNTESNDFTVGKIYAAVEDQKNTSVVVVDDVGDFNDAQVHWFEEAPERIDIKERWNNGFPNQFFLKGYNREGELILEEEFGNRTEVRERHDFIYNNHKKLFPNILYLEVIHVSSPQRSLLDSGIEL